MGMVALALRLCLVRALRGKTFAEQRVHDSQIIPLDETLRDEAAPHISVYTDDDEQEIDGRNLMTPDARRLDVVLEVAAAFEVVAAIEQDESVKAITLPQTDAALEAQINLIERQIMRVLVADQGAWADMWRRLATKVHRVIARRGASSEGVRYAARQIVITVDTLAEPAFEAPSGVWIDFLALLRTDPELEGLADLVEAEIAAPALAGERAAQAALGLSNRASTAIGLATADDVDVGDPSGDHDVSTDDLEAHDLEPEAEA